MSMFLQTYTPKATVPKTKKNSCANATISSMLVPLSPVHELDDAVADGSAQSHKLRVRACNFPHVGFNVRQVVALKQIDRSLRVRHDFQPL
jgi:hypothetical protein